MTKYIALNPIGTWTTVDNETAGFWTTFDDKTEGGVWIKSDGGDNGIWIYESEDSTAVGTWQNTNQTTKGNWYTAPPTEEGQEADPLVRIVEVIPDCFNTNFELLDSGKLNCSRYESTPDQCGNFDTAEGFVASYMCCSCGGGSNTEMTSEELIDRLTELTAKEYEANFNLDYFRQFPRVIEFDCDKDKSTQVWSSQDELYLGITIKGKQCEADRGCFIDVKSQTSGTNNILGLTFDCDDSVFEEYEDEVTFYVNEFPDKDITTSSDGRSRTVTSEAIFECSEVLAMPIEVSIFYDSEKVGTSVSFDTQINLKKSSEKKAEEIEEQLRTYNLQIDDDPQEEEEEIILEATTTEEEEEQSLEEESTATEEETAEAEGDEAATEEEKTEEEKSEEEKTEEEADELEKEKLDPKEDLLLEGEGSIALEDLEVFELPPEPEVDMEKINEKLEELPEIDDIMQQEEIDIVASVSELFTSDEDECESEDQSECDIQFEAEVVTALEVVLNEVSDVVQKGKIPAEAASDNYDESDAEELTKIDLTEIFSATDLGFEPVEVQKFNPVQFKLKLSESFSLPDIPEPQDDGAVGVGFTSEIKKLTFKEMAGRFVQSQSQSGLGPGRLLAESDSIRRLLNDEESSDQSEQEKIANLLKLSNSFEVDLLLIQNDKFFMN